MAIVPGIPEQGTKACERQKGHQWGRNPPLQTLSRDDHLQRGKRKTHPAWLALESQAPKPQDTWHNQESGRYYHHLLKFILLEKMGEQGRRALDPQKFALLPPGNIPLSLPPSISPSLIPTCASEATDLGVNLAKNMARHNYIPSQSLSGPICKMGLIVPPHSMTEH